MIPFDKIKDAIKEVHEDDSGQAMVEAAIIFPLYIAVICVIIETALLANAYFMTDYAAYCAARAGIVNSGDVQKMQIAASIALGPISNTAIPGVLGLGGLIHADIGDPLLNSFTSLVTGSTVAYLQFNEALSIAEYFAEDPLRGVFSLVLRNRSETINHRGLLDSDIEDPWRSINQVRMLNLNNTNDGGGSYTNPTYTSRFTLPGAEGPTPVPLHDQYGTAKRGYRYTQYSNMETTKKLRIRVQVSHSHRFMFQFLPQLLSFCARPLFSNNTSGFSVVPFGPGADDMGNLVQLFAGRINVRGFALMRMQSNLIEDNMNSAAHGNVHTGAPSSPF